MESRFSRAFDHLVTSDSKENIENSLQAVEDLFGAEWLNQTDGHRLQLLWNRPDHIATSELYSLGKSIVNLIKENSTWLTSTAREIKKSTETSHGLITEIITIGSILDGVGEVIPCSKSNPIYDYTIDYKNGYSSKVSIKNFDISKHEKDFNQKCEIIKKTFENFLKFYKTAGALEVICLGKTLTSEIVELVCCSIAFKIKEYGSYDIGYGCLISFKKLSLPTESCVECPSGTVLVIAKQHKNEQRNIESKILSANKSMLKDPRDKHAIKKLIIRLGETTDSDRIKEFLQRIGEDYNSCGFDLCFVFQPTIVSDSEKGSTGIVTRFIPITRSFSPIEEDMKSKLENVGLGRMEIGIGTLTTEKASWSLEHISPEAVDLSDYYLYQKGDVYIKMQKKGSAFTGNLSQLAPGIKVHAVMGDFVIQPKIFPDENKLLIV